MTKTRPNDVPLPPPEQFFLTRLEACRVARIGLNAFDNAVKDGRLVVRRNGTRIIVTRSNLYRFMGVPSESLPSTRKTRAPAAPGPGAGW
ncbi:hypothetical protein [Bradyrhizobium sp. AZCC 1693]|uniref:hypothetical protein n=1 Tax=Bradyrhizobium sp. AZCC 1693 TaxID=3117029 RepID=UPI002FF2C9B0